jgi:hypothetical protein
MPDAGSVNIDVLSLEDFEATLNGRLAEADFLMRQIESLRTNDPGLGLFDDASKAKTEHDRWVREAADRLQRLQRSLQAAKTATNTILTNYKTTEARNAANANDIAGAMAGVNDALKEG